MFAIERQRYTSLQPGQGDTGKQRVKCFTVRLFSAKFTIPQNEKEQASLSQEK